MGAPGGASLQRHPARGGAGPGPEPSPRASRAQRGRARGHPGLSPCSASCRNSPTTYSADVFSTVIVPASDPGLARRAGVLLRSAGRPCAVGEAHERRVLARLRLRPRARAGRCRLAPTLAAWVAGVAIGIAPFLALNAYMFGSPLRPATTDFIYEQSGAGDAGLSCRDDFDRPVVEGLRGLLLDLKHGAAAQQPRDPARARRHRSGAPPPAPRDPCCCSVPSLALLLMMSRVSLPWMEGSPNATRFLLVPYSWPQPFWRA